MMRRVRRWLIVVGLLCFVLGATGFLVAASGIIPIRASSGHRAMTEWILQFGKRRSIAADRDEIELRQRPGPVSSSTSR